MQSVLMQPINYTTFRELEESVAAGIPEIMLDLIDTYIADTQETFKALVGALTAGNWKQAERNAHSLKSSSATFGAEMVAHLCAEAEHHIREGNVSPVTGLITSAQEKFVEVERLLQAERTRLMEL